MLDGIVQRATLEAKIESILIEKVPADVTAFVNKKASEYIDKELEKLLTKKERVMWKMRR